MNDCPAHASDYAAGQMFCHLAEGHTGEHWNRYARARWAIEVTYDTEEDQ